MCETQEGGIMEPTEGQCGWQAELWEGGLHWP